MIRCINIRCIIRTSYLSITPSCSYSVLSSSGFDINNDIISEKQSSFVSSKDSSKLVAAAFASLKEITLQSKQEPQLSYAALYSQITEANDVDTLLGIVENHVISSALAFKIVSILSYWASSGRVKLSDFETDARFITLCSTLSHKREDVGDLSIVLGITGDDQAAKLVSSINTSQMVKVMASLSSKRKRSLPLLRSLSFNIGRSSDQLNIKEAADILYACGVLNFPDEVLIEKVTADICSCLQDVSRPAVIGSILTSLGHLRYKNQDLLEELLRWIDTHICRCRIQEFIAVIITLANVNYKSQTFDNIYDKIEKHVTMREVNNNYVWLDIVWSLVVLNKATSRHLNSVLSSDCLLNLLRRDSTFYIAEKMKLLNINGAAKLNKHLYKGVRLLENVESVNVLLSRTKEKQLLVDSVRDTLTNLLPLPSYANFDVDTKIGYLLDGEFMVDADAKFLPLSNQETHSSSPTQSSSTGTKIALSVHSYHDVCRGCHNELTGISNLTQTLTTQAGYKVLSVPYIDFNPKAKLLERVQYLEQKIKSSLTNDDA